jgi:hypothetical protein
MSALAGAEEEIWRDLIEIVSGRDWDVWGM